MDSFEWNKILGAILGSLLFVFIVKEAAHVVYHPEEPGTELAYKIEIPETAAATQTAEAAEPEPVDFGALLQEASAESGEGVAKRCLQCHSFEKGGVNKVGPNLWSIIGKDIAAVEGFRYSNALSQKEGEWTYEKLYNFLAAPSKWAPGTSMNFAGLRRQQERINMLAYLRTQADSPPPIPEPLPAAQGDDEGTPAGEDDAAEGEEPAAEAEPAEGGEPSASGDDAAAAGDGSGPDAGADPEAGDTGSEPDAGDDPEAGAADEAAGDEDPSGDDTP